MTPFPTHASPNWQHSLEFQALPSFKACSTVQHSHFHSSFTNWVPSFRTTQVGRCDKLKNNMLQPVEHRNVHDFLAVATHGRFSNIKTSKDLGTFLCVVHQMWMGCDKASGTVTYINILMHCTNGWQRWVANALSLVKPEGWLASLSCSSEEENMLRRPCYRRTLNELLHPSIIGGRLSEAATTEKKEY